MKTDEELDYLRYSDYMYNSAKNDYNVPDLSALIASIPGSVSVETNKIDIFKSKRVETHKSYDIF